MAGQAELESLQRQVKSLSTLLARTRGSHQVALDAKQSLLIKKTNRVDKAEKLVADLKTETRKLRISLEHATTAAEARDHQIGNLRHEIKILCAKVDAANTHLPSAK